MPESTTQTPPSESEQDLSWLTQSNKEELLSTFLETLLNKALEGTGAKFLKQTDEIERLTHDWVLVLKDGTRLTIEGKIEDYALSLFPELAQIVIPRNGARRIEFGWAYKTTADFMLYLSPVSGVVTLLPRKRTIQQQILLARDVLVQTADYDIPCLLNAALNPEAPGSRRMSRAGIGIGLLRTNILRAYVLSYGSEGLYQFDVSAELRALQKLLASADNVKPPVAKWAENKLMSEPVEILDHQATFSLLPSLLEVSPLVLSGELHAPAVAARGYDFFRRAVSACVASGQTWLFEDVPGVYVDKDNTAFHLISPLSSGIGPAKDGQFVRRKDVQSRSDEQLKRICDPAAPVDIELARKCDAYLFKAHNLSYNLAEAAYARAEAANAAANAPAPPAASVTSQ